MARTRVVSLNSYFLTNVVGEGKCVLEMNCLDHVVGFFVICNQVNEFLYLFPALSTN